MVGAEFDWTDRADVRGEVKTAEAAAKGEVWSGYRFVILSDAKAEYGLKVINLGAPSVPTMVRHLPPGSLALRA
jgi:hypothetical protein